MSYQFKEYELVQLIKHPDTPIAGVRGWNETGNIYTLLLSDGQEIEVQEDDLKSTGQLESPFYFFEVVTINPLRIDEHPEAAALVGKRGVVTGISGKYDQGHWGFAVSVQSGECWYFEENELSSTGIFLSEEQVFGPVEEQQTVRLRYNPITEEETVISGNAELLKRGPIPLAIDLESLQK